MTAPLRLAAIGAGALGGAIIRAALAAGTVTPDTLTICTRSGTAPDFGAARIVTDPQAATAGADLVLLAIPPAALADFTIAAPDCTILSVIAGASLARLEAATGSARILRAMSSPAAARGLAFSPVCPGPGATRLDRDRAARLFAACGETAFVDSEAQIDSFTALTGPVPGLVAFFAAAMIDHATRAGIAPDLADRAIRQLFLAAGTELAEGTPTAEQHVAEMVAYAGTTAAGLDILARSDVAEVVDRALAAATARARTIAETP